MPIAYLTTSNLRPAGCRTLPAEAPETTQPSEPQSRYPRLKPNLGIKSAASLETTMRTGPTGVRAPRSTAKPRKAGSSRRSSICGEYVSPTFAAAVVDALPLEFSREELAQLGGGSRIVAAQDAYLKGISHVLRRTPSDLAAALRGLIAILPMRGPASPMRDCFRRGLPILRSGVAVPMRTRARQRPSRWIWTRTRHWR